MPAPEPPSASLSAPADDLSLIVAAARAAGEIAAEFFGRDIVTRDKGDGQGPVTEADLAIEDMLKARLLADRPDYGWLSEEAENETSRLSRRRVFIVDPIDGTRAFIAGQKTFGTAIAVAEAGDVIAGVMHLPLRDETFTAYREGGARLNGARIEASTRQEILGATALAGKMQLSPDLWPGGVPPVARHFRPAIAHRLCLVAQGRFDALITLRPSWEWDVAAGGLIAQEAGAVVTTAEQAPPRYNNPQPRLSGMIVAGPALHHQIMDHLHPDGN